MTIRSPEVDAFLRRPIISIVGTVRPDGSPHLTPVWHYVDGDRVVIAVERTSVKAYNIRRNPSVSLCVAAWEVPQTWVMVNGIAELSEDRVDEIVRAVSVVYKGPVEGEKHADRVLRELDFVLVSIEPTSIVTGP